MQKKIMVKQGNPCHSKQGSHWMISEILIGVNIFKKMPVSNSILVISRVCSWMWNCLQNWIWSNLEWQYYSKKSKAADATRDRFRLIGSESSLPPFFPSLNRDHPIQGIVKHWNFAGPFFRLAPLRTAVLLSQFERD